MLWLLSLSILAKDLYKRIPSLTLMQTCEWTRMKLRIHSAKLRKGAWLQPEPHFKITNPNYLTTHRDFQTTIGGPQPGIFRLRTDQKSCYETKSRVGKEQPRNYEARGRTVRCVSRDKRLLGHFSRVSKWHFSDFIMHFWGFGVPGLCMGAGHLQDLIC